MQDADGNTTAFSYDTGDGRLIVGPGRRIRRSIPPPIRPPCRWPWIPASLPKQRISKPLPPTNRTSRPPTCARAIRNRPLAVTNALDQTTTYDRNVNGLVTEMIQPAVFDTLSGGDTLDAHDELHVFRWAPGSRAIARRLDADLELHDFNRHLRRASTTLLPPTRIAWGTKRSILTIRFPPSAGGRIRPT